jgi:hypothetical protein
MSYNITGIPERQIHMYTGVNGMDLISHAFAVRNSVDYAKTLKEMHKITEEEFKNLETMLKSEDRENFEIGLMALTQLGQ